MAIPKVLEVWEGQDYVLTLQRTSLVRNKQAEFGSSLWWTCSKRMDSFQARLMNGYSRKASYCLCFTQMIQSLLAGPDLKELADIILKIRAVGLKQAHCCWRRQSQWQHIQSVSTSPHHQEWHHQGIVLGWSKCRNQEDHCSSSSVLLPGYWSDFLLSGEEFNAGQLFWCPPQSKLLHVQSKASTLQGIEAVGQVPAGWFRRQGKWLEGCWHSHKHNYSLSLSNWNDVLRLPKCENPQQKLIFTQIQFLTTALSQCRNATIVAYDKMTERRLNWIAFLNFNHLFRMVRPNSY